MSKDNLDRVLYFSFFFSGISGLIYEVLWAKYLSLIFGSTTYAHTLVLSTFMGGLALGSFLLGSWADRVKDKLTFYAWTQIGIAIFCVFTPKLFSLSKDIYLIAAKNFSLNPVGIVTVKFVIGAFIMLPPTILMGGTLPILSKFMIRTISARGDVVARLYYINSFGAVVGTIFAGFYLIYHLGLEASIMIAVLINLLVGIILILIKDFYKKVLPKPQLQEKDIASKKTGTEVPEKEIFSIKIINLSLVCIFLSGFVAMLYEIVWIRLLSTILGSSTYSFSLMLAAFISGITLGSFLISKYMPRIHSTFLFFGLCEMFIGISLILSLPFYEKLPFLFLKLSGIFSRTPETFLLYSTTKFLLSFLVMLPPTVFFGMTLPLVSKIASQKLEFLGRKIGSVFAFNTAGDILGALIAGLLFIPLLGLKHTLELGVIINLSLGILILCTDNTFSLKRKLTFTSICCLVFFGYKLIIPDWNKTYFTAELFRHRINPNVTFKEFSNSLKGKEVVFYEDGLDATVAVAKSGGNLSLYVNGKADASTGIDMPTQMLSAQIPLILKPQAKDILVVGLGSGVTCGSALLHPIDSLDLVEISSSVVKANKYFAKFNYDALKDKRLHLHLEDAKTFLQRTEKNYDVIISEPPNPWTSGVGALFSIEFFADCYKHLGKSGLMVQWVQGYEMDEETFKTILRTFLSIFPEVTVWSTGVQDTFIIGSKEKLLLDFPGSEKRIAQDSIKKDLSRINLQDLFTLCSLQIASSGEVKNVIGMRGLVNSDYFPILDYKAPLALYTNSNITNFVINLDERYLTLQKSELFIKDYLKSHNIDYDALKNLFQYIDAHPKYNENILFPLVKKWHREYPEDREAILAYTKYNIDSLEDPILALEKLILKDKRFENLDSYAALQFERYQMLKSFLLPEVFSETIEKLKTCIELSQNKKATFYHLLGKVYLSNRDYENSIDCFTKAEELAISGKDIPDKNTYLELLNDMSSAYLESSDFPKAFEYVQKVLFIDNENSRAKEIMEVLAQKTP